jgi:hypothetical protein
MKEHEAGKSGKGLNSSVFQTLVKKNILHLFIELTFS